MEIHKPKTIKEAINDLQTFFEADLYTKFRPKEIIKGEIWEREDRFKNKKEFDEYLNDHFNILRKQVKGLEKEKYYLFKELGIAIPKELHDTSLKEIKKLKNKS